MEQQQQKLPGGQFPATHKPEQIHFTLIKGSESIFIPIFNYKKYFAQLMFFFLSGWWDTQFLEL